MKWMTLACALAGYDADSQDLKSSTLALPLGSVVAAVVDPVTTRGVSNSVLFAARDDDRQALVTSSSGTVRIYCEDRQVLVDRGQEDRANDGWMAFKNHYVQESIDVGVPYFADSGWLWSP